MHEVTVYVCDDGTPAATHAPGSNETRCVEACKHMEKPGVRVFDVRGEEGVLEGPVHTGAPGDYAVRLASGERIRISEYMLTNTRDGSYQLNQSFNELRHSALPQEDENARVTVQEEIIPIVEETARIEKRTRETGRVRVTKHVVERLETIDKPLLREEVEVERVPIDRVLDEPIGIRHEGDVTIIPVYEERLVVRKELVLKEELHVRRRSSVHHDPQEVLLRTEAVDIERTSSGRSSEETNL